MTDNEKLKEALRVFMLDGTCTDEQFEIILSAAQAYHALMTCITDWEKFIVEVENMGGTGRSVSSHAVLPPPVKGDAVTREDTGHFGATSGMDAKGFRSSPAIPLPQNALDALAWIESLIEREKHLGLKHIAVYETILTALKQSSAEVVTVDYLRTLGENRTGKQLADYLIYAYPNVLKIIRSEK